AAARVERSGHRAIVVPRHWPALDCPVTFSAASVMNRITDANRGTIVRHAARGARRAPVACGIVAAAILVGITAYRLERPGVFYDEVHQATGAFTYIGRPSPLFSLLPIRGLPLLNMPYSGAIKTG